MSASPEQSPVPASADELWEKTLALLREDGKSYALTWLDRMQALEVKDGTLILGVPDRFFRDWVDDHYRPLLEDAISRVHGGTMGLGYEVVGTATTDATTAAGTSGRGQLSAPRPPRINERFTFVNYVVAESNQLPAAAAAAVAESPGRAYNPLFIYGGTGLGKTHLLHAVGNAIFSKNPGARIVYLSSEEFTNEFVESVRDHKMTEFRRKFRDECDVLLIDDIQFLGKREETQKEFFYTFNALHEMSKAIVLTSDAVPAEIPGLEDRLRSRFTMGLITDIQEPNYETRVAILKKKAEIERVRLPDDVAYLIASRIKANIREIEGSLTRMIAFCSLSGREMSVDLAQEVLSDLWGEEEKIITIEHIQRKAAEFFGIKLSDMRAKNRTKAVAFPRQIAMFLARNLTHASLTEVGRAFGGKDHTTVLHAVEKIQALVQEDPKFKKTVDTLTQSITL